MVEISKETQNETRQQEESNIINSMSVDALRNMFKVRGEAEEKELLENLRYTGRLKSFST